MSVLIIAVRRSFAPLMLAAATAFAPGLALAHGGGELAPATRPPAPPGDGATAERIMAEIKARTAKDADAAKVIAEALANSAKSLERAHGARAAGDGAHARMLDGLALEWAETARDLLRAREAEFSAKKSAKKALELATQAERARTLLEETQARRGRAEAELAKVQAEAEEAKKRAASAEEQRLEAAKKGKGGAAKKPKGKKGAK